MAVVPAVLIGLLAGLLALAVLVMATPLQVLLHTVPLQGGQWVLIGLLVLPILLVPEILKTLRYFASRRQERRAGATA